jgi:mono/diheme cytochrome c family protein
MNGEHASRARLVVRPLALFLAVSTLVFGLAELHLAKPGVPKIALGSQVALGDQYRGETLFGQTCASCHGIGGKGGSVGPRLVGDQIGVARVKAQIDQGGGAMPPALISGQKERDVLAYVATLIAAPG